MMKKKYNIIGISGSGRDENTNFMLRTILDATGCDYELVLLKDKDIKLCTGCGGCYYSHKCIVKDDMQELYAKMLKADIIVLGCPTYFANVSALMKIFMDRCLPFYFSEKMKNKKVAIVSVGNFKKGEVRFLDNFDIEKTMESSAGRKELKKSVQKCVNIMEYFCTNHMKLKVVGSVISINSNPELEQKKLIKLGKKFII